MTDYRDGYFPINVSLLAASSDSVSSPNRKYRAVMQGDGNFVLSRLDNGKVLWSSETTGKGKRAIMQGDGNFVIYDAANKAVFATNTTPEPQFQAFLVLQDDGNLVMYQYKKQPLWATYTAVK